MGLKNLWRSFRKNKLRATQEEQTHRKLWANRLRPTVEWLEDRITPANTVHDVTSGMNFATIQAAVNAANPGDTILADAGTYAENVTVNKPLILEGAQHGVDAQNGRPGAMESILDASTNGGLTPFNVTASNVTIDGFTIQNETSSNQFGFGILLGAGTSGSQVLNNIIQNNIAGLSLANNSTTNQTVIQHNLFQNNNQPGPTSGDAIYTDQFNAGGTLSDVLIDNNTFKGNSDAGLDFSSTDATKPSTGITISNNLFDTNARGLLAFNLTSSSITGNTFTNSTSNATADIRLFEGVNGLSITNNLLENGAGRAVRISNTGSGAPDATNVSFNQNSLSGYTGPAGTFQVDNYSGTLDASNNYWGSPTGPTTPNNPGGTGESIVDPNNQVNFSPYYTSGTNTATGRGFTPSGTATTAVAVVGTNGNDTLIVNATSTNSGTYSLNGGPAVAFSNITRFSFAGLGGSDTLQINNPTGGLFAPTDGIFYDAGGQSGDNLQDLGGSSTSGTYTPNPSASPQNAGTLTHTNGTVTQTITFTGLAPITDTVTENSFTVNATDAPGVISYQNGGTSGATQLNTVTDSAPGVETVSFGNKTNVTVNTDATATGGNAKSVDVQFSTPATALTNLTFVDNGAGGSGFSVLATPAAVNTTITGSSGGDTVNVEDNTAKIDQILGPVTFNGSGSSNALFVTDTGSTTPYTYTINNTSVARSGGVVTPGTITYSDIQAVHVSSGSGADTFDVQSSPTTTYFLDAGPPTTSPGDTLNFDAQGLAVTDNGSQITQPGRQPVNYTNFETINFVNSTGAIVVDGTSGNDVLVVNATNANSGTYQETTNNGTPGPVVSFSGATSFTFNGMAGSDTLQINNPAGGLFAPSDGVFYNGGGQTGDNLQDLGGSSTSGSYTPNPSASPQNAGTLTHTNGATTQTITFTGLAPITDTVTEPTFTYNSTDVAAGAILYQDGPNVGGTQENVINDQSPGAESLTFANKTNMIVNTDLTAAGAPKTVDVQFATPATALTNLTFNDTGVGGDGYNVMATPAAVTTTLNGGSGGDSFNIEDNSAKLDQILGPVTVHGGTGTNNRLFITDTSSTTPYTYTITGTTVARSGGTVTPGTITYSAIQTLQLNAANATPPAGNTINMTGAATGTSYTLNAGSGNDRINVSGTGSAAALTVNGQAGADTLTVDFSAGNPSPVGGINYHGGGQAGDNLVLDNITATNVINTFLPDSSATPHVGTISVDGSVVNYDGVFPVDIAGTMANLVINLPTGDGDNQAILEDNATPLDNISQVRSGNGTFETTQFTNPTTSLTLNTGNDGETVTFARLDPAYNPTNGTTITGGAGQDTFRVDFSSGTNVIPTGGITFNGGADNGDAIIFAPGYTATNVTHTYTDNHSGSIVVDGRTLTYSGLSQTRGIFDPLAASTRTFTFSSTASNNITLGDDPTANNGISRISSTASNPTTDFANPTTSVTVNLGNAGDTITAGPLDATSPPPTIALNGGTGSDTFNVTPSTGSTFNVDGNLPNPPTLPGDTLNVTIPPGSNPVLTSTATPTGFTGNYTFLAGGFQPVNFTRIETLAPSTVDLAITKDDGDGAAPETEVPGTTVTYTIVATNSGPLGVTGVTISDMFPVSMPPSTTPGFTGDTFTSTAMGGATGNTATGSGNINDTVTLPAGSSITYIATATINPSSLGTLSNTATITPSTGVTDSNPANNTSTDADPLTPMADLAIAKTGTPDPVLSGNNLTYTITVNNNGPSTSQNVVLTDAVPTNTTFVSFTPAAGFTPGPTNPMAGGTGQVTATDPSFMPGTATFTLVVRVNPNTPGATVITNQASINSTTTVDQVPTNNVVVATNTVNTSADLGVTKTGPTSPVTAGQNVTYTLTATNIGPSDAQVVALTDALPAGETFVSETQTSGPTFTQTNPPVGTNGTVSDTIATLAAGSSATFTLVAQLSPGAANGSTVTNTANITSSTTDSNPANNSSSVSNIVVTSADLQVTKTGPATATAGNNLTYTVTVTNAGPSDAQGVNLTDAVPPGTTFVSEMQTSGTTFTFTNPTAGGTGTVSGTAPTLAAGASATFTIVVKATASDVNGSTISNTATAFSSTADSNPANNSSTATTTVATSADLGVTKTGPATVTAGTNATYTITVTNTGPSDAQGVQLTDATPTGTTFVSETQTGGTTFAFTNPPAGGTGTVSGTAPTLAAGASATFTLVVMANASDVNGSTLSNTANVTATTSDPNPANNTSTAMTAVATSADVGVTKTGPATVTAGTNATYTITVTNTGPSDAQGVQLTDATPAGTTFVSETQTGGTAFAFTNPPAGGTGTVSGTAPTLAAGASATFTLVVKANANDANGSMVTNTANVTTTTADPNPANNTSTVTSTVATSADVGVSKMGPATVTAGTNATYTITVTNTGPSDAQGVTTSDVLPANTTLVSFTQDSGPAAGGPLAAGGTETFTLVLHVNANAPNGATITNTANVTTTTSDPNPANNSSAVNSTVATSADLAVTKTGPATVTAGTNATYTITLTNTGPSDAQGVQLTDATPTGTTFVSETQTGGPTFTFTSPPAGGTGTVSGTAPTLAAGASATFTLVVKANASDVNGSTLSNTANVTATTADPNLANNTSTATTTALTSADLAVTKTGPATVTAGTNATYTITLTNTGPSDAQGVQLTDATPAGTTFVSETQTGGTAFTFTNPPVGGTGTVSGTAPTLAAGATATFTLVVKANANDATGSMVSNTAIVSSTTADPNLANNSSTATSTVAASADLGVTKTGPATVTAGSNATYTITLTNTGPSDAQGVQLTDATPTGTTFVSETQTGGPTFAFTNPPAGGTGTVSGTAPTLAAGASATFTLVVMANANDVNGSTLSNTANVTATTSDPNPANNTSTAMTTVATSADVGVTKTGPTTVTAGTNATYTITVTNTGPSDAQGVQLTDATPTGTTFVSETQTGGPTFTFTNPPAGGTGTVSGTAPTLAAGASATFTLVVMANASDANGSMVSNTANVTATTADPNPANNTSTVTSTVATSADLGVSKVGPATVTAGTSVIYTITLTNSGPSDAQNVTLTDVIPNGTTQFGFAEQSGPTFALAFNGSNTFTATRATFAAGQTAVFLVGVFVSPSDANGSMITNTASVTSNTTDPNSANNTSAVTSTVATSADLGVSKTGPATVTAGTNATYTITLTNTGPSDAQGVQLTDATPTGTTFVSETQTGGPTFTFTNPAVGGTGTVSGTAPTLAAGASATFTLVVKANASDVNGSTLSNTANVTATTSDPNLANNTSTATTTALTSADLAVTKTGPAMVTAGTNATYTITVTNNGPSDAQGVQLTDATPAGTTFVSETQTGGTAFTFTNPPAGGTGTVSGTAPTLAAGASATFTLVVTANANDANGSTLSNTANVNSTTADPNLANNSSTATSTVATSADLGVTKTGPATVTAGTNATYTITLTNTGPSDAQGVQLTDATPAGTTFVSETQTGGTAFTFTNPAMGGTGTVSGTAPTLAAGASATFTLVVKANASDANGSILSNTANVTATTADPNPANNTSTAMTTVATSADVGVTKTGPATVTAGTNATYTITLTNTGPSDAQGVQLTDALPAGTTFVSFTSPAGFTATTPAAGGTGTVTATEPTLAAGTSATFTLVVQANANDANGSMVSNTANVISTTADPNIANNTSTATTTVATSADVGVTKTGPATVTAGSNATYTITLTNTGPSDAQGVQLTDATPTGTTFVSETQTGGPAFAFTNPPAGGTGTVSGTAATFAAGASATFTLVVKADASDVNGSTLSNTANVTATTADPNPANNTSTATTTVATSADVGVTKTGPTTVTAGSNATYTITLTNTGPSDAQGVQLTDATPAGTTFVSETQTGGPAFAFTNPTTGGTGTVSGTITTFAAGASATFTLVVKANANDVNGTMVSNTANVTSTTADANLANNTSTVNSTVAASADVGVTKTGPTTVSAGSNATYTITVTNTGPSDAQGVQLTDATPTGTTFVSETQTSGTTFTFTNPPAGGTGTVSGTAPTLAAGASATFTLVVMANATDANGSTISNTANVTATTTDPNAANNSSTATTTALTSADLAVSKTGPTSVTAGTNATYTITLTNNGPSDAQSVNLTDVLPAGTTFVSETQTGGPTFTFTNPAAGGTGTVSGTITTFAANASATFTLVVKANSSDANGLTISNTANVSSNTTDANLANNTSTATTTALASADLGVSKAGPTTVTAGTNATYTITVTNSGPSDAQSVQLTDAIPTGTTFVSETQTGGPTFTFTNPAAGGTGTVSGTITTFAANASATFTLVVRANANDVNGSMVTNTATVNSTTADPSLANNTSSTSATVAASADVGVSKTGPATVTAGSNATYTITLTNTGPSDAQGVQLTDAVPTGTTFVSETQTGGPTFAFTNPPSGGTGTVSGTAPTLAAGASATFTLVVKANAIDVNGSTISNTANVAATTSDANLANNTSTAMATVATSADLGVTKTGPATVTAGTNATYTITLTNTGPSDAQTVALTDAVPTGTTFVSETQTGGPTFTFTNPAIGGTGTVSGTAATFAAGASATFTLVVKANANTANGSTLSNTANVNSTTADANLANNTSTATSTALASADLAVSKTGPATVTAGSNATYTITVTNNGPSDAQAVQLTDAIPTGTTFVSETQTGGTTFTFTNPAIGGTGTVSGTAPTLAAGASATFTLVVKASANDANGSTLSNTANVNSTTADSSLANNTSTVTSTVAASTDVSVTKTGPATVTAGSNATYTITVSNSGPSDAQSVQLTDAIPTGSTFVSETQTGGPAFTFTNPAVGGTGTISGTAPTLAAGTSATFIVVVQAGANDVNGSTLANTASVSTATADSNPANNSSTVTTTVSNPPPPSPRVPPPFVSVAITPYGEVVQVVDAQGNLRQYDAFGVQFLGSGFRSSSFALSPFGEILVTVTQAGVLQQFDASGLRTLGTGVLDASVAFGPFGEVLDVVTTDGVLTQFDAAGAHTLGSGVVSAGVAISSGVGEVLEVAYRTGELIQYDLNGAHPLLGGVLNASAAFNLTPPPAGTPVTPLPSTPAFVTSVEVLDVIFSNGNLTQFTAFGQQTLAKLF